MPLKWTKQKPTEPGFYWLRSERMDAEVVRVQKYYDEGRLVYYSCGGELYMEIDDWEEWAGPIDSPIEPDLDEPFEDEN